MRSGPGRGYDELAVLSEGEICEFLGSTSRDERGVIWYRVRCGGVEGWVSSRYTALVSSRRGRLDEGRRATSVYVRATGDVNVRSGPGVNYEDLGALARGECLTYLDETRYDAGGHAWYKAQYYSYGEVWVSAVYSELTSTRTAGRLDGEAGTFGSYIQATGRLNVRSGPGLGNYESIAIAAGRRHRRLSGPIRAGRARRDLVQDLLQRRQRLGLLPLLRALLTPDAPERAPGRISAPARFAVQGVAACAAALFAENAAIS